MALAKSPQYSEQNTESPISPTPLGMDPHSLTPHSSGINTPNTLEQDRELLFDSEDIDAAFGDKGHQDDLPDYEASSSRAPLADASRCSILPSRTAVWKLKDSDIRLSAFVAAILLHQGIISTQDLEVYQAEVKVEDQGPRDPVTGLFTSVHTTVGGIVHGIVDYPVEISKIVQADGDVAKGLAKDFALDSNKGVSRIIGTSLRAPGDITMNLSRGFGNVPKLYGDESVRPAGKVDGIASGLEAAGKGFGFGLWDGITGLYTQPAKGLEEGGVGGFFTGLGKGIGGAVFKPAAGAIGLPAYALKGVYEEVAKLAGGSEEDIARAERIKKGNEEWELCTTEERQAILGMWYAYHREEINMQDREQGKWN